MFYVCKIDALETAVGIPIRPSQQRPLSWWASTNKPSGVRTGDTAQHISRVAQKNADGFHQLTIDDKCQYGQKNGQGDTRFVVYHDKGREPYRHRFIETSVGSLGANVSAKIVDGLCYSDTIADIPSNYIGDYFHTF